MKAVRALGVLLLIALFTSGLLFGWYRTAWSDFAWRWLANHIDHGYRPGFISDVEFILVASVSLLLSTVIVLWSLKRLRVARRKRVA